MWNVHPDRDKSRGGFQDSDVGRTQFDKDYGPEFGVDYARFSDPPDVKKDLFLKSYLEKELSLGENFRDISVSVRNGFVVMKGKVHDDQIRTEALSLIRNFPGVVEVINQVLVEHVQ